MGRPHGLAHASGNALPSISSQEVIYSYLQAIVKQGIISYRMKLRRSYRKAMYSARPPLDESGKDLDNGLQKLSALLLLSIVRKGRPSMSENRPSNHPAAQGQTTRRNLTGTAMPVIATGYPSTEASPPPHAVAPSHRPTRELGKTGARVEIVSLGGEGSLRTHGQHKSAVPMI